MSNNIIFANNASALLAATITDNDLTVQVAAGYGANFPSPTGDQYFMLTLEDDDGTIEIVKITGRSTDNLTMDSVADRGQEGTSAAAHVLNATRCELRLTKAAMEEFLQKNGGTMTGNVDFNGNNLVDAILTGVNTRITNGKIVNVPLVGHATISTNAILIPTNGTSRATVGGAAILAVGDDIVAELDTAGVIILNSATVGVKIIAGAYLRVQDSDNDAYLEAWHDDTDFNFAFTGTTEVNWDAILAMSADLKMADNQIIRPVFVDFAVKKQTVAGISTTDIDYEAGSYVILNLEADIASFAISNPPSTDVGVLRLKVVQDSTDRAITWPASVKWPDDSEPDLTSGAGAVDFIDLWSDDGGVIWYGAYGSNWS